MYSVTASLRFSSSEKDNNVSDKMKELKMKLWNNWRNDFMFQMKPLLAHLHCDRNWINWDICKIVCGETRNKMLYNWKANSDLWHLLLFWRRIKVASTTEIFSAHLALFSHTSSRGRWCRISWFWRGVWLERCEYNPLGFSCDHLVDLPNVSPSPWWKPYRNL